MTKEQFRGLLLSPATINLNLVGELEEITNRFPYFQNAHLLLAKQYHGHENIRFESYLRKAAAYAPDRSILYNLIKENPAEIIHITKNEKRSDPAPIEEPIKKIVEEETPIHKVVELKEIRVKESTPFDTEEKIIANEIPAQPDENSVVANTPDPRIELKQNPVFESTHVDTEEKIIEDESRGEYTESPVVSNTTDPRLVIEQRLKELKKEEPIEPEKVIEEKPNSTVSTPKQPPAFVEQVAEENTEPVRRSKLVSPPTEVEPGMQKSILPRETPFTKADPAIEKHSFTEWLRMKSIAVIPSEDAAAYFNFGKDGYDSAMTSEGSHSVADSLLENFIKNEPRIVPARSEFYSPGNMARKSALEHEDLISETLARIYAQQGNIQKAIEAYHRLSLKNPEKSSYFAALIKDLEEKLNEN